MQTIPFDFRKIVFKTEVRLNGGTGYAIFGDPLTGVKYEVQFRGK